jgi:predicted RNA-binding protein (TIGR00451 family)
MFCQNPDALRRIRRIADYQFGKEAGEKLFPDEVKVKFSKRTGRVRHVYLSSELLATLRPSVGLFSLTIEGAKRLFSPKDSFHLWVRVQDDVAAFIEKGGDVFAKHVVDADLEIRPMEEVIVLNSKRRVVAVGKAALSGAEMKSFRKGVAVKVRRGRLEKAKKQGEK